MKSLNENNIIAIDNLWEIYNTQFILIIGDEYLREFNKNILKPSKQRSISVPYGISGTTVNVNTNTIVIHITDLGLNDTPAKLAGVIAHESYHAVHCLKNNIREESLAEEFTAHLVGWLTETCCSHVFNLRT